MTDARFWNRAYRENPDHVMVKPPSFFWEEVKSLCVGRVLELGCGTGENLFFLASKGWKVEGVDFSREAISKAKKEKKRQGFSEVNFFVKDVSKLRLKWKYDLIISLFALPEELKKASETIKRVEQHLLPKGHFILCEWDFSMEKIWNEGICEEDQVKDLLVPRSFLKKKLNFLERKKEKVMDVPSSHVFPLAGDRRRYHQDMMKVFFFHGQMS